MAGITIYVTPAYTHLSRTVMSEEAYFILSYFPCDGMYLNLHVYDTYTYKYIERDTEYIFAGLSPRAHQSTDFGRKNKQKSAMAGFDLFQMSLTNAFFLELCSEITQTRKRTRKWIQK